MKKKLFKYSATGNLFIVLDNRDHKLDPKNSNLWILNCKKYKVDGVLLLENSKIGDFRMRIINSDGGEVSMCGNGLRAITHFAYFHGGINQKRNFKVETDKGVYETFFLSDDFLKAKMTELYDVNKINIGDLFDAEKSLYLNTGVPHCVFVTKNIDDLDINKIAHPISLNPLFKDGVNVNFVEILGPNSIKIRTFERGVYGETLSCGTGATAGAIAVAKLFGWEGKINLLTKGGNLEVILDKEFKDIYLCGKVENILSGELNEI
jgi:diaminopimelate epimerase